MKREAANHTKMKRLCRRLDLPRYVGMGIMEALWHLTATEAICGDIGKLSNEDIALGIDYRGDENALIEALTIAGWLDRDPTNRLMVHDWWDHCEDAVHMKMARSRRYFADGRVPKLTRLGSREREEAERYYGVVRDSKTHTIDEPEHDQHTEQPARHNLSAQDSYLGVPPSPPLPSHPITLPSQTNEDGSVLGVPYCEASPEPPPSVRPSRTPREAKPFPVPEAKPIAPPPPRRISRPPGDIDGMRRLLHGYMAMQGTEQQRKVPDPDDAVVVRCLVAIGDRPLDDVGQLLRQRYATQSPRHPNGPKSYAWFPTVLEQAFGQRGAA